MRVADQPVGKDAQRLVVPVPDASQSRSSRVHNLDGDDTWMPSTRLGAVDPALVAIQARRIADGRRETGVVERPALRRFERPAPSLAGYDALLAGSAR